MAYNESDAERMRSALKGTRGIYEQPMFGGICYLWNDHMLCGIGEPGFMFRVGKEQEAAALKRPGTSPIVFNGRRFGGLVWVEAKQAHGRALTGWIDTAKSFVRSLPPKTKTKVKGKAKAKAKRKTAKAKPKATKKKKKKSARK